MSPLGRGPTWQRGDEVLPHRHLQPYVDNPWVLVALALILWFTVPYLLSLI